MWVKSMSLVLWIYVSREEVREAANVPEGPALISFSVEVSEKRVLRVARWPVMVVVVLVWGNLSTGQVIRSLAVDDRLYTHSESDSGS